jgi:tetratricopeptide (TPR) repeat protein
VFYHRGPDHPLSLPVPADETRRIEQQLQRTFAGMGNRKRLSTGFIGRRSELHRIRHRLREGDRVLVFQGLGGLGKTTLAFHTLPLLGEEDDVCSLWCQEAEAEQNPAEQLVGQLLAYCRQRFGAGWESVVQQVDRAAQENAALRFTYFLQVLLQNVSRLVLYLDNMESLLLGPDGVREAAQGPEGRKGQKESDEFASWRSQQLGQIWETMATAARDTGKLHLVASCRYRHEDFNRHTIPVSPLPPDALYRLMGWFPGLRRLSTSSRARLVSRLAGHPRAVEFANDLIDDTLHRWQDTHGTEWPAVQHGDEEAAEHEWLQLVEPALPKVRDQLWGDLLLGAIWDRVLDEPARRMLYRMTLLRRPWDAELMKLLGEEEEPAAVAEATADRLRRTSLLEQVEYVRQIAEDRFGTDRQYTLHPATSQFITSRFADDPQLRRAAQRRLGDYLEAQVKESPYIETDLDAGHHLFEAGEFNRSCELLVSASDWLRQHGRVREGLQILLPFLAESVLTAMDQQLAGRLLGTMGLAYGDLGQVEKAISYYEQCLVLHREIGDRRGEGADLGNLGEAYGNLGQVEKAIGYYEQCLVLHREIGDRHGEGIALLGLGNSYFRLGQVEKAIGCYEQRLVIAREIGDRRGEGTALANLGLTYAGLGQVEKAIGYYEQQLVIGREIKDPRSTKVATRQLQQLRAKGE